MRHPSIRIEGSILSGDIIEKIENAEIKGQKLSDFGLSDKVKSVKDEIATAWADAQDLWRMFRHRVENLSANQTGTSETRNQWMVPFLGLLGYRLEYQHKSEVVNEKNYAISHLETVRDRFPVHIMGFRDSLDKKRQDSGPRMSPHALVQEYLNLTEHLYAIVTNGLQIRLLRDSTRLVKLSYLEFNIEQIMEDGIFADFALLFRILHISRMPLTQDTVSESPIEQYHQDSLESGSRIRDGLSEAVKKSIVSFANGFLNHPDNQHLREDYVSGHTSAQTYYQFQLRLIYRLLFLLVIEERDLVYPPKSDPAKRKIYYEYYSVSKLRRLADKRHLAEARHKDLWIGLQRTFALYEDEEFCKPLDIKPLAGELFSPLALNGLQISSLDNQILLECMSNLSVFVNQDNGQKMRINYAALNVEEFGSVYEGLLEYDPSITQDGNKFYFSFVKGQERSSSGTHYTPDELVSPLIKHSLEYVIQDKLEQAQKQHKENPKQSLKEQQEAHLLSITVCDVACGSGHILLNAARRIAMELACIRTGEDQPSPLAFRAAVRDVIRHCIFGVDINPLAVELCKVALWLEAHNPAEPLNFLDHHIKCGNAIVGLAHQNELQRGIPEEAFMCLPNDDKQICKDLREQNKRERKERVDSQKAFEFEKKLGQNLNIYIQQFNEVVAMPEKAPREIESKHHAYTELLNSPLLRELKNIADIQLAQFFIPKIKDNEQKIVTDEQYWLYLEGRHSMQGQAVGKAAATAQENRFFHWFLEFPKIFANGGFDCVLGNPPFLGNKKLSGTFGDAFLECIKYEFAPIGAVDLVTYFFRRIYSIIKPKGFQSLISTNTIAQGNAREDGLDIIVKQGGSINHAVKSMKWPGKAAVEVSTNRNFSKNWRQRQREKPIGLKRQKRKIYRY